MNITPFLEAILFPRKMINPEKIKKYFTNKTILITGASYGIGEALAYGLADSGSHLILVARTESKLMEVKQGIENQGGHASVYAIDLTKEDQIELLIKDLSQFSIDIVVSNAGRSIRRSIFDSLDRMHDFTRTMAINYFAPVRLILGLMPVLQKNKAHVIQISAVNVLLPPFPRWAAYQASKTAFDQWFRSVAFELNSVGICTTSIYFPLVKTRMIEPTKEYQHVPSMSAKHAAKIICLSVMKKKTIFKPWWLSSCELFAFFFAWILKYK